MVTPRAWTTARVEAWLDWADTLPGDLPPAPRRRGAANRSPDPLLGGGPDRYASRLAAWGLALGVFEAAEDAEDFRADLFAALVGRPDRVRDRQLAFGARVHPLAERHGPAARAPVFPRIDERDFAEAARRLRAGRGLAPT